MAPTGHTYPTTVGADKKWEVQMNSCDVATGLTLIVTSDSNNLSYANVACGQVMWVFLCRFLAIPGVSENEWE